MRPIANLGDRTNIKLRQKARSVSDHFLLVSASSLTLSCRMCLIAPQERRMVSSLQASLNTRKREYGRGSTHLNFKPVNMHLRSVLQVLGSRPESCKEPGCIA